MGTSKQNWVNWTDLRLAILRREWKAGSTAGTIARLIGAPCTRSSVIGKAHRLGLDRRESPIRRGMKPAARPKSKGRDVWTDERVAILVAGYAPETAITVKSIATLAGVTVQQVYDEATRRGLKRPGRIVALEPLERRARNWNPAPAPEFKGSKNVPLPTLGTNSCRFPTSPHMARHHLFCGCEVETPGHVYCDFHHAIAHREPVVEDGMAEERAAA